MKSFIISLLLVFSFTQGTAARAAMSQGSLARALEAADVGEWDRAAALVAPAGPVARDIVAWRRLRESRGSFEEYVAFVQRRKDWPGLALLRLRGETSIPRDADPARVIAYFADGRPGTGTGALRLARALERSGKPNEARRVIVRAWRTLSLSEAEEAAFLARHGKLLINHHRARQDMLLWRDLATQAGRLNRLVGTAYARLARARIALIKGRRSGVNALIAAVPKALADDPGLAFDRFRWRLNNGRTEAALKLILERSTSARALGRPQAWASGRRRLVRELMRAGKAETAYRLASRHFLTDGDAYKDLEWLSGFIALSDLNDPALALVHFRRFRAAVDTPISLGRAGYWEGRALEALGKPIEAQAAYAFGGEYQTSFYGQLAAEKAGLDMDPALAGTETYSAFSSRPEAKSSLVEAARLAAEANRPRLVARFLRQLAERLEAAEIGSLAQFALNMRQTYSAVILAKYAARRGVILVRPYFPAPRSLRGASNVPPELKLAIIRRESEFNPDAASSVGARGLMQVMPQTGKAMARTLKIRFDRERLLNDPAYNARLGTAYLEQLMNRFDGYLPLVAAAYNAGPSRAARWEKDLRARPRTTEAAVDWIEHLPFNETRNYVMRVMESLAIYRARLAGRTAALRLSRDLLRRR